MPWIFPHSFRPPAFWTIYCRFEVLFFSYRRCCCYPYLLKTIGSHVFKMLLLGYNEDDHFSIRHNKNWSFFRENYPFLRGFKLYHYLHEFSQVSPPKKKLQIVH